MEDTALNSEDLSENSCFIVPCRLAGCKRKSVTLCHPAGGRVLGRSADQSHPCNYWASAIFSESVSVWRRLICIVYLCLSETKEYEKVNPYAVHQVLWRIAGCKVNLGFVWKKTNSCVLCPNAQNLWGVSVCACSSDGGAGSVHAHTSTGKVLSGRCWRSEAGFREVAAGQVPFHKVPEPEDKTSL